MTTTTATPNCEACPLAAQESRRVLSHGPLDAAVVVVGKAPDEADLKAGKPFAGGVGSELMRCLQRAGWGTDTLLFANAVCCQPPDKFSFTKKALDPCFPVLDELIRSHPRKLIIALGNEAFASIMHVNPTGVEKGAGLVKQSAYNCPVLWTHHPFKVSMSPQVMPQFVDHLKKALHISVHGADHDPAENARKMMVREPAGLRKLVDYCKQRGHAGEMMAFDIETTGTDRFDNEILGIAFGFCDFGAYVPLKHGTNGSAAALDPNSPELLAYNAELAEIDRSLAAIKQQKLKPAEERKLSAPFNARKLEMSQAIFPVSDYAEMVELLRELLEDPDIEKCAHFGKFDTTFIINKLGIHTRGYVADPMLLHTLLDENLPHGLKYLSRQELGAPDYDADTKEYFKPGKHLGMAPLPTAAKYAALDCIYTARLVRKFLVDAQQMGVLDIHDRLLMPLTYELGQLELTGMQPDPVALEAVGDRVEKRMAQLFTAINEMTGLGETKLPSRGEKDKQIGVNPGSDADLRYVLFEYYGLPVVKRTDGGTPSVDKEVRSLFKIYYDSLPTLRDTHQTIEEFLAGTIPDKDLKAKLDKTVSTIQMLARSLPIAELIREVAENVTSNLYHNFDATENLRELQAALTKMSEINLHARPVIEALTEYSRLQTISGTFYTGTKSYVREDGRVHCVFGYSEKTELTPNTGRLSANSPNLQQVMVPFQPVYVPPLDWRIIQSDFAAIEVRGWAALSADQDLMRYIGTPGLDFHREMAAVVLDKNPSDVTKSERQLSKTLTFGGCMYGGDTSVVVRMTGCTETEARLFLDRIYARFPVAKSWLDGRVREANETHQVISPISRIRHLPDIVSVNRQIRAGAQRMAQNSIIQGLASDKNNMALIEISDWLRWMGTGAPWLPRDEETSWEWLERRFTYKREIEDALREVREKGPVFKARPCNTVHDCLIFEVPPDEVGIVAFLCHNYQTRRLCPEWPVEVPLVVETKINRRWNADAMDLTKICDLEADDL